MNGAASPPSARTASAVAAAASGSRSTARIRAPSRANRSATAPPLPTVPPGRWPAPTTSAVFPSSLTPGTPGPRVALDPERAEGHRHQLVLAHGEDQVDHLLGRPRGHQGDPRGIGQTVVVDQLVDRPDQERVARRPPRVVTGAGEAGDLRLVESHVEADRGVLAELVLAAAAPTGAEDHQLPRAGRQRGLAEHVPTEGEPPLEQLRVVGERGEDVEPAGGGHHLRGLLVPVGRGRGRQTGRCGIGHRHSLGSGPHIVARPAAEDRERGVSIPSRSWVVPVDGLVGRSQDADATRCGSSVRVRVRARR